MGELSRCKPSAGRPHIFGDWFVLWHVEFSGWRDLLQRNCQRCGKKQLRKAGRLPAVSHEPGEQTMSGDVRSGTPGKNRGERAGRVGRERVPITSVTAPLVPAGLEEKHDE